MNKKTIYIGIPLLVILGLVATATWSFYKLFRQPAIEQSTWIYIYPQANADSIVQLIANNSHIGSLWVKGAVKLENLEDQITANKVCGAYKVQKGECLMKVVRSIAHKRQTPVRFTFNNIRLKEELAGRIASYLMMDSVSLCRELNDTTLQAQFGMDSLNIESLFLPDTYEVYWDITPLALMERMQREYDKFWTEERKQKAKALNITPQEASVIASIAEEETQGKTERGVVARLYWNRLQRGMLLQADPTVKYAVGDFSLTRIVGKHLKVDSPYNTYKYVGLPPGPIRIPEKATIDALLNSQPHDYLFMCAKEDFSGRHNFATTLAEHYRNAAKYHKALNELSKSASR